MYDYSRESWKKDLFGVFIFLDNSVFKIKKKKLFNSIQSHKITHST